MFEKIFNRIYRRINNYHLSLIISVILFPIYNALFRLRIMLMGNGRKVTLTEEESKELIVDNRPHYSQLAQLGQQSGGKDKKVNNRPLLSIIVPAYNVERYVEECMNSILCQDTRYSFEVIVINDGSTDATLMRLKQYEADEGVNIITGENCGLSGARNQGINNARGQYYMFVDSDDRLAPGAIEALMSEVIKEQADIVEGNFTYFGQGISSYKGRPLWNKRRVINLREKPGTINDLRGFACAKIYAKRLWQDVRFPEGYIFEDTITKFIICRRARKYVYIPSECYEYRQHSNSITKASLGSDKSLDSFFILPVMLNEVKRLTGEVDAEVYRLVLIHMGSLMYRRTKVLDDKIIDALLLQCRSLLLNIEKYCPAKLSFYEKTLKNAIMNIDKNKWILCCSMN